MVSYNNDCLTCRTKSCSILKECEENVLRKINSFKISKPLSRGQRLFSEGDPIHGVYFIKKGYLKVELNGKKGRPLILRVASKGSIFGHRMNHYHSFHSFSVTAVSDTEYCFIPSQHFRQLAEANISLQTQLSNQYLNEIEETEKRLVTLAHKTVREKIAEAILLLAKLYDYDTHQKSFRIHYCRQDLADLTGTTKEQVSKTLNDFITEDLVKCHAKKFTFLDVDKLVDVANINRNSLSEV